MSRNAFGRLCQILENTGGLRPTRHLTVSEQVAIFLSVLVHHKKNYVVKHDFNVRPDYQWEGSAADGRVLRDSLSRSTGLKVPPGMYYLCDNGYANGEGFLTPYRGVRYHLKEWDRGGGGPQNARELFNLRHAAARNVIERSFGLLKTRWGILRSPSYYSIDVQSCIVVACCLLHNYVRMEMPDDPLESEVLEEPNNGNGPNIDFVSSIETTTAWTAWHENLAANMYAEWLHR
ncbi:UNVERIFIED_CONTAM: hypothetical protein Sradi_0671400 [Sesamum radiatum]|uniref:DDE Tnp4 domain-containing protein n=1 Tax=Sesamum radiatum TaxID=300843 RepID=A0AAW2VN50_SESRA